MACMSMLRTQEELTPPQGRSVAPRRTGAHAEITDHAQHGLLPACARDAQPTMNGWKLPIDFEVAHLDVAGPPLRRPRAIPPWAERPQAVPLIRPRNTRGRNYPATQGSPRRITRGR